MGNGRQWLDERGCLDQRRAYGASGLVSWLLSEGVRINDSHRIVGFSTTVTGLQFAVQWISGNVSPLSPHPSYRDQVATSINNSNDVVGEATNLGELRGVKWPAALTFQDIGISPATAINDQKDIAVTGRILMAGGSFIAPLEVVPDCASLPRSRLV